MSAQYPALSVYKMCEKISFFWFLVVLNQRFTTKQQFKLAQNQKVTQDSKKAFSLFVKSLCLAKRRKKFSFLKVAEINVYKKNVGMKSYP